MTVTTIDPSTGRPLATYEETTTEELDGLLDRAHSAAQRLGTHSADRARQRLAPACHRTA